MSPQRKPRQSLSSKANDATPFSQLTYLLQLITSLNFDENLSSSFHRAENAYHDDVASDSVGFTPLDSIAAILVQQHEVVAACYTSDQVSVIAADTIPATDIEVGQSPFASGSHTCHSLQLAALSNPDFSCSGHLDTSNLHNVQIETEGEDLWTKVQGSSRWYCAFMGPRPLKDLLRLCLHILMITRATLQRHKLLMLVNSHAILFQHAGQKWLDGLHRGKQWVSCFATAPS